MLIFPLLLLVFCAGALAPANAAPPALKSGVTLSASTRFPGGEKRLPDAHEDGGGAALIIAGDNITVDLGGTVLRGTSPTEEPDTRRGTGILVRGKNVTIRNARVHGYKIGLLAKNAPGLKIEDSDFSYNWKQRLGSTLEREDEADWMSFHQNEKDEWLRYGAGIYLRSCDNATVKKVRIVGGQCGLMMTSCNKGLIYNNNFSFLSGIGIGMYRSSQNRLLYNKADWCVRGYSHGVYNRGQDSAGILVYEQSSKNVFAYNSVTHGGDGFFLWAGQTTMDTGKGGCDDNLVFGNDFSHAPTNGIEATFSRNTFCNNLVMECWHGVWGGYSHDTEIIGNIFGYNATAIAIEHGRDNEIGNNRFLYDNEGIRLWQNKTQDPNWGYPKFHETTSRNYNISANVFFTWRMPLNITDTPGIAGELNPHFKPDNTNQETMEASGNSILKTELDTPTYLGRFDLGRFAQASVGWRPYDSYDTESGDKVSPFNHIAAPAKIKDGKTPFLTKAALRGRRYILVNEWGPYDFRSPILWPREEIGPQSGLGTAEITRRYEILGPKGKYRVVSIEGGRIASDLPLTVPGELFIAQIKGKAASLKVNLEYIGAETTDYRGVVTPAGKPVVFSYRKFFAPIDWQVKFYAWEKDKSDPRTQPEAFAARLKEKPLTELTTDRLDFAGYKFAEGVPADYFATVAEGKFTIAPGDYVLEVTTDDGCRVFLDGKSLIADAWKYQGPTLYKAAVKLGGSHTLRVEHFQIDGYAALKVNLRKK